MINAQASGAAAASLCMVLCLSCLVQCLAPVDAPSAFEAERFLCDDEHLAEFEALLEECRQARESDSSSCAGVLSLQGVIDSQPVVLEAFIARATYVDTDFGSEIARTMTVRAPAPYFAFMLDTHFNVDANTGELSEPTHNAVGDLVNLEGRGANYFATVIAPRRRIPPQPQGEIRLGLSGGLSRGGAIDSCVHAFPRLN